MKSLVRRPLKTVMLFVIFLIVFNLAFTGYIIENSIVESKNYIRNQMGGVVEYRMDFTSALPAMVGGAVRPPALSLSVAEKIAANRYVQSYFITEYANANSDGIEPAETQQTGGGFQRSASEFVLVGSNQTAPLDLAMGKVKLSGGSLLSQQNLLNGDSVVVISQDIALKNGLRVGDTISLTGAAFYLPMQGRQGQGSTDNTGATAIDYEVVGIYEAVEDGFNVNTIYTSLAVTNKINNTGNTDNTTASIVYILDSPNHVEAFKQEASPYLTSEYHSLYSNDDQYKSLTRPLDLISFITSILIWVVLIAGAAIILAVVTIFVRDRKFEIGLLLSSGESKMGIVSQFIIEIVIVAIIAFGISVGSSHIVSQSVSDWIVENQLLAENSFVGSTGGTAPVAGFQPRFLAGRNLSSIYGEVDMESVAAEFDVSINASVMGNLFFVSLLLVLAGASIPLSVIMRYNPKRILQDY
jgi:putative ABC transport system permease protein